MRNMKSQQGKVRKKAEQSCVQYLAAKSSCDLHLALFSCNLLYLSLCYPKTSISLDRSCKQLTEHTANKGLSSSQNSSFVQLSRQLQGLGLICAGVVLEIKIIQLRMAEQGDIGCTSLDFLSKLQVSPKKKRVFCKLSLNTDLEQINQVLKSPVARVQKIAIPTVLDIDKTKTFVMSLLQKYEKVEEIEKKWEGFMMSVNSPLEFQKYVGSLKEIAGSQLCRTNPENGEEAEQGKKPGQRKRAAARAASVRRVENKEKAKEGKVSSGKLRELLKQEIYQLKDLLLAGEKFIHSQ